MKNKYFILILLIIIFSPSYSQENIRVLFTSTYLFEDGIIFSVKVENLQEHNIYILLDYTLERIEYREDIKTILATVSGEPYPLGYDGYYPSDFVMPNINVLAPGQKQLFHIIIRDYKHGIQRNNQIMRTVIDGLYYFLLEPPNYYFWGAMVGFYSYRLYFNFFQNNSYSFDSSRLLGGG